jgi:hypothetical protein
MIVYTDTFMSVIQIHGTLFLYVCVFLRFLIAEIINDIWDDNSDPYTNNTWNLVVILSLEWILQWKYNTK